jgi:hypothetical protein
MVIALHIAAAAIMAVGSLFLAWQNRDFRKFLTSSYHRVCCSTSISQLFRCLCRGQVSSKHLKSAVAALSFISSSSCSASILASSGNQRLEGTGRPGNSPPLRRPNRHRLARNGHKRNPERARGALVDAPCRDSRRLTLKNVNVLKDYALASRCRSQSNRSISRLMPSRSASARPSSSNLAARARSSDASRSSNMAA